MPSPGGCHTSSSKNVSSNDGRNQNGASERTLATAFVA